MSATVNRAIAPSEAEAGRHGFGLEHKVAVVTGASSGIGAGIAQHLGRLGARVVLVGRDVDRLASCAQDIVSGGGDCRHVAADLTAEEGPSAIVRDAVDLFGRIDVLVHAAGIFRVDRFEDQGPDVLDEQYRVNVRAPYALTHAALPHLGPGSAVVFISSNLAQVGMSGAAAYCGTKGAVDAMARSLAVELAPRGIRINTVAPGIVRTPMTSRLSAGSAEEAAAVRLTPAGRLGDVADIAAAVGFVCSPAAGYMVGATMLVDGGWNAQ
jgi:NAD(P)-dependent dehydrogenase (short-subunit alcohol dehydrogenase family)